MGPVFSAAFLIPLIAGVSAAGKGAGCGHAACRPDRRRWGHSRSAGSCAQYAKRVHAAGLALRLCLDRARRHDRCVCPGLDLLRRHDRARVGDCPCLVGWYMHDVIFTADPALPGVLSSSSPLPMWGWSLIFIAAVFVIQYFGVRLSTRAQLTLALVSLAVVVLGFFVKVILDAPKRPTSPSRSSRARPRTAVVGNHVRRSVRRPDLRRLRNGRESRGGPGRTRSARFPVPSCTRS